MRSEGRWTALATPAGRGLRPILVLCGLYGAQAIPLYLVAAAFPPILRARGVDLALIGSFGVLMAPWALKFLWAPVVDRFGSRRVWILGAQALTLAAILALSGLDPVADITRFFPLLMLLSLASATQDIATDAYAVEHLAPEKQALGSAIQSGAVAAGVLLGGSLTLFVYDQAGWQMAVLGAALLSALATLPVLFAAEKGGRRAGVPDRRRPSFRAFWARPEARMILIFALLFRVPEGLVKAVEQSFFVDVGFSLTKVGLISGGTAACVGLAGSALGAIWVNRAGLIPFLWAIIVLRTLCFGGYLAAAELGMSDVALIGLSALNTFSRYMEIVGLYTAFIRTASLQQAGTDFTILASANLFTYMAGSMAAGVIASAFGYGTLFTIATVLSLLTGALAMRCVPPTIELRRSLA
jgi:PAT family beta-lactamase induction signal transducer AmpG